ncbi:hypothetical protein OH77DRAFT_1369660, partial [Trametes cingulata]
LDERHPQYETHILRKRTVWVVPVLLGGRIPRADRGPEEREAWARCMLLLFVPWRSPQDLKSPGESWWNAYERLGDRIQPIHRVIIGNMNVLTECKDARD